MDPRTECTPQVRDHAEERRSDRGLATPDLVRLIRRGTWRARADGLYDVVAGKWRIRIMVGRCTLWVETVMRR